MGKRAASSSVASIADHCLNSDGLVAHNAFLEERARAGQGYKALRKSLEKELGLTCSEQSMRTWVTNWKSQNNGDAPDLGEELDLVGLGPHNGFLEERARAGQGYRALRKSLQNELSLTCSESTMRAWVANWKSRSLGDAPGTEASSAGSRNTGDAPDPAANSAGARLNSDGLVAHNAFLEERARAGQGYKALRKSLQNELGLTCSEQSMRTWLANRKSRSHGDAPGAGAEASSAEIPDNGDAADPAASSSARLLNLAGLDPRNAFLEERARAGQSYRALKQSLENELGVTCSDRTMRTWMTSWKSRSHGDAPGAEGTSAEIPDNGGAADPAASSSARVLNLAGLDPHNAFLEERARAGQSYRALKQSLENELGVTCSDRTMRTWLSHWESQDKDVVVCENVASFSSAQSTRLEEWASQGDCAATMREKFQRECEATCSPSTMRAWLDLWRKRQRVKSEWDEYVEKRFSLGYMPIPKSAPVKDGLSPLLFWICYASWTFCACGRTRPNRRPVSLSRPSVPSVAISCSSNQNNRGHCGKRIDHILYQGQGGPEQLLDTDEVYVCPRRSDWPVYDAQRNCFLKCPEECSPDAVSMLDLTAEEAASLQIVNLFCDYKKQFGERGAAPVYNVKKLSVVRAEWKEEPVWHGLTTDRAKAAYLWLREENPVYRRFLAMHEDHLREVETGVCTKHYIPTAKLLLQLDGVETAARPVLYPHHAFGDSDLKSRLCGVHLKPNQVPNMRQSFLRKALSPCAAYNQDPLLIFLIHDIAVARSASFNIGLNLTKQKCFMPIGEAPKRGSNFQW